VALGSVSPGDGRLVGDACGSHYVQGMRDVRCDLCVAPGFGLVGNCSLHRRVRALMSVVMMALVVEVIGDVGVGGGGGGVVTVGGDG